MKGAEDPRVARTRRAMVEAYVGLCAERMDMSAPVADICRRAGVNRATFYRHFEDRADLLDRGLDLFFDDLASKVEAADEPGPPIEERVLGRIAAFFTGVSESPEFFKLLLSGAAGSVFMKKAERFAEAFMADRRVSRLDEAVNTEFALAMPASLTARALAAVSMTFASWWLDRPEGVPPRETPREIAALYLGFITRGLFRQTGGLKR